MNILKENNTTTPSVGIELVLAGEQFDLELITNVLNVKPTVQWRKGDTINNRQIVRQDTTWSFGIGLQSSYDIEEQSKQFLSVFINRLDKLKLLKSEQNIDILILYTVKVYNSETPIMSLNSEIINFARELGAKIDFDLYFC